MDVVLTMTVVYFCSLVFCFYLKLEWTHPAVVHSIIWLACCLLVGYFSESTYLPKDYYILVANLMFFIFAILGAQTFRNKNVNYKLCLSAQSYVKFLPFVFILTFYFVIFSKFSIGSLFNISAFREYLVADDGANYGMLGRLALLSLFSSCFLILRCKWTFFISSIFCLPMVIMLGAKTLILLYLVVMLVLTPKKLRFSKVLFFSILFILFFYIIMSVRYPDSSFNLISYYLYNYMSGGFLAFAQLEHAEQKIFGFNSLRNIYLWVSFFYPSEIASIIQNWVFVPFPVNVYSYLRPYYLDFGYVSIVFPMLFGFISGRVYVLKFKNIRSYYILYPIILYAILMQLFDDQYLTWISNWILLIIVGYLMTWDRNCAKNSCVNSNL
ncbi:O-antigen polymerase [Citrobacter freundii]|uniref:O-antigen polymerase n=1 Tax=Citrobacter freundii TaxID=546 RepID=UPI001A25EC8E|nr:O-antigen polymerase [Citrobacter freundii]ELH0175263.1 oligosaccharide repeat unit polymerase [Citrobacter freundii]ELH7025273.1 oligosaccharide repeat unit polymerase [Citrobacter freundii]WHW93943.1 O-antigen ligase [Citrobacter freundii]HAT1565615.1 oligosaccharide repeat unit polymerase [Citrobacter freundii]HCB1632189.1 oligosaccharide repeat unit polymerase [Citrobacter freundii]